MLWQFSKRRTGPAKPAHDPEEILARAGALFRAEQSKDLRDVVAEKIKELRHYDVLAMDRVASIVMWGKSGSLLLASYFDGHEDVMTLPGLCGTGIYSFFGLYRSLPLRDKLISYPAWTQEWAPFFEGNFAISSSQYYAAVQAILDFYSDCPEEFLESRRTFFLFLHIAYNLALGRPASSHPLIVFAQHFRDNVIASQLVEDFPEAKFIHTIRDPISLASQILSFRLIPSEPVQNSNEIRPAARTRLLTAATSGIVAFKKNLDLLCSRDSLIPPINGDRPHFGMGCRTMAARFEDLHCRTAETLRSLSDWLGLSYGPTLIESTFNGIPWVVTRDGKTWSGPRLEQAQRDVRHISAKDRVLLFALFHKNFAAWKYPHPKIFGNSIVRCVVFLTLFLLPMKVEIVAARALLKSRILPAVRRGNVSTVINSLLRIVSCRLTIISVLVLEFVGRCALGKTLLRVDHHKPPLERRDVGLAELQETK